MGSRYRIHPSGGDDSPESTDPRTGLPGEHPLAVASEDEDIALPPASDLGVVGAELDSLFAHDVGSCIEAPHDNPAENPIGAANPPKDQHASDEPHTSLRPDHGADAAEAALSNAAAASSEGALAPTPTKVRKASCRRDWSREDSDGVPKKERKTSLKRHTSFARCRRSSAKKEFTRRCSDQRQRSSDVGEGEPLEERRSSIEDGEFLSEYFSRLIAYNIGNSSNLVVDPDRKWVRYWNLAQLGICLYQYVKVTSCVAFMWTHAFRFDAFCVIDWITDIMLLLHVLLQFTLGYLDSSNNKVMVSADIRQNYLRSPRFLIHVIALVPLDLVQLGLNQWDPLMRLNKSLRLLEVPMLLKAVMGAFRVRMHLRRLLLLVLLVMLFSHTISCLWYLLGSLVDSFFPDIFNNVLAHDTSAMQYLDSFYYSLGLMTGLADGEVPQTPLESVFTLVVMLVGWAWTENDMCAALARTGSRVENKE